MLQQIAHQIRSAGFVSPWLMAPSIFLAWLLVLLSLKKWLLRFGRRQIGHQTGWTWADALIEALSPALTLAIIAGGMALLDSILPLSTRSDRIFDVLVTATVILSLMIFSDRICRRFIDRLALHSAAIQGAVGLLEGAVRGVVLSFGVLICLDSVGISVTPLIASLGIGTVAVALALQDTLVNLFAGAYIVAEKPVEAGHFVKLDNGEQGYVTRVGWRSTHIRMLNDSMIIVPNSKLASSTITNFSLPSHKLAISIDIGVDYESDLERVERITLKVAQEVIATSMGAAREFEPCSRYHTLGELLQRNGNRPVSRRTSGSADKVVGAVDRYSAGSRSAILVATDT